MLFFLLTETSIFMCIMNEAQFLGYEINIITSVVQVLFDNNGQTSTMSKCILVIYSWYYRNRWSVCSWPFLYTETWPESVVLTTEWTITGKIKYRLHTMSCPELTVKSYPKALNSWHVRPFRFNISSRGLKRERAPGVHVHNCYFQSKSICNHSQTNGQWQP